MARCPICNSRDYHEYHDLEHLEPDEHSCERCGYLWMETDGDEQRVIESSIDAAIKNTDWHRENDYKIILDMKAMSDEEDLDIDFEGLFEWAKGEEALAHCAHPDKVPELLAEVANLIKTAPDTERDYGSDLESGNVDSCFDAGCEVTDYRIAQLFKKHMDAIGYKEEE